MKLILIIAAALLTGACAGNRVCNASADYRNAAAIPPIQPAEGLKLPTSPAALKVPELTPGAQEAAKLPLPRKGNGTACLDYPPEIAPIEPAISSAKS